jgi:predicted GNAT family acetyltransferase
VAPGWRRRGLAAALVSDVTGAILAAGRIPWTSCGMHNLASLRIAHSVGYRPAWTAMASRGLC